MKFWKRKFFFCARHLIVWIKDLENIKIGMLIVFQEKLSICIAEQFYFFVSVFCCSWHVGCSLEVINECIQCLDEIIEFVENNYIEH
jgi:hypothetical protein